MRRIKYILLIIALFTFTGCSKVDSSIEKVDIRGSITSISVSTSIENKVDSLLVEGNIASDTMYDKASIKITKDTVIIQDDTKAAATTEYLNEDIIVEIKFAGPVAESYPVQATADIIRIISPSVNLKTIEKQGNTDPIVNAYMLIIDTFYKEDEGLNGDIKYLAIDTTKMVNLTDDSKQELLTALGKYNLIVLNTTFEDLKAEGLIKDLYFEEGILFKIEDEPITNNILTLKASKWRSGLGAIGTDKMELKKVNGTWKITSEGGRWIS